ncbi:DUF4037 domain-containing protein [Halobacillus sp. BAB-2008]|uniref:DUF4037 domain-containing protein n=1 Tax=Halobacillus sp. BAB-2008 TaxID=1246484 RepID=UPI0002A4F171|nr:DUF4037 domain-containing protein [Halobacillus sp. BAB-2008]ELK45982.1 hypothetical protein D479_12103 [Halobacillus sp. BAB-2008]
MRGADLVKKAEAQAAFYAENPKVEVIFLAGSVARGWDDAFSDIELHILWKAPPTEEDRIGPVSEVGGSILSFEPYEDEEWSEAYTDESGLKFEISSFLTETVERYITDVVEDGEFDYDKQCILSSIQDGKILYGKAQGQRMKTRTDAYPDVLAAKMISENLELTNRWSNRQALKVRGDWLMFYDLVTFVQKKLMGVLFGMNRMYVQHPSFKWMVWNIDRMEEKPDRFGERMSTLISKDPADTLADLEALVEEVRALVSKRG